jgi:glycosyltransferase involved in cell wall biosynthesis
MRNVLYISYDGMTDPLGQSQVIPYLQGLSAKGYSITLISCEKPDRFISSGDGINKILASSGISWHPVTYSLLPSIVAKQLTLFALKRKAIHCCKKNKFSIVHCRSYMASLIGLQLKARYNLRFIFDMRGFWADERLDGKLWSLENFIQRKLYFYFKRKEVEFLTSADYTISLTENAKQEILSWPAFQNKRLPIEIIPCCADLNLFSPEYIDPVKLKSLENELGIKKSDFVLSYLGSVGTWYLLDEMLDFFACLLESRKNSKFLIISPDDKNLIMNKASAKGIPSDKLIIVSAARLQVPLYLSLSAVSVYFIRPLYSKKASSPTKTAEIMGLGIPVITNRGIGDSDRIIAESDAGLLISEFTKVEYMRAITEIDVLLKLDKDSIRKVSEKYFALSKGIEKYDSVYRKLLN